MNHPLFDENVFLLYSIAMGIFITFTYDIFRIFRRVFPHNSFFVSLEDLLFWIFSAVSVFLLMQRESNGTLRWFAILGALCGMLFYKKIFSGFLVKWSSLGLGLMVQLLSKVLGILVRPIRAVGRKTKGAAKYGGHKGRQFGRFLQKRLTALIKMLKIALCKQ